MVKNIKKVAVLGSGIMGSGIACHLANVGIEVLLLDIIPENFKTSQNKNERNSIVNKALTTAVKSKPSPLYKNKLSNITTGNFDDDFEKIENCDWIIEVVVERLDIKNIIFEKVDQFRKQGAIVSSNTSGIPINSMLEKDQMISKHISLALIFFNPPRYLRLLEIIPTNYTDKNVVDFMHDFGSKILGKTLFYVRYSSVYCKPSWGICYTRAFSHCS